MDGCRSTGLGAVANASGKRHASLEAMFWNEATRVYHGI